MPEILLDNEYATVVYDDELNMIHHTFHQAISGEKFREVLDTGVEGMQKYDAYKWLSDDRKNSALPDEDMEWATGNWFPRVKEAGWEYWALVVPPDIKARMLLLGSVIEYGKQGLKVQLFTELDEAKEWLESV